MEHPTGRCLITLRKKTDSGDGYKVGWVGYISSYVWPMFHVPFTENIKGEFHSGILISIIYY